MLDLTVDPELRRIRRVYWTCSKDAGRNSATALATARLV
jgi:hypothetical protein